MLCILPLVSDPKTWWDADSGATIKHTQGAVLPGGAWLASGGRSGCAAHHRQAVGRTAQTRKGIAAAARAGRAVAAAGDAPHRTGGAGELTAGVSCDS